MYSILSDLTLTTVNSVNSAPAPQKNFYLTCPQCNSFCMMDTSYFYHASITLTCDCGYNKKLFLSDYLLQMRNNHKPLHNLCKKHRYQSYISFCLNCKSHLCKTCIESGVHQSHSIESLALNKKYPLKTDLSTIANTVENFRVNLDNILIKIGNTRTMKNAIKKFYANLLDIQSYLTQLYYCYETIPNYYIQQTIHFKETKHIKDGVIMTSQESLLGMNLVMSSLSTYLEYYSKEDDYRLKILEGDTENGLGEFYDPEDNQIAYRGYIKNKIPFGFGILYTDNVPTFIGECKGFKADGYGKSFDKESGLLYKGIFTNDIQTDYLIVYDENGNKTIEADCREDELNGIGILYYENGGYRYKGMISNNEINGYGTYYDQNGKVLMQGEFKHEQLEGCGMLFQDGKIYIQGEFRNGKPDGYGTVFDINGKIVFQGKIRVEKSA